MIVFTSPSPRQDLYLGNVTMSRLNQELVILTIFTFHWATLTCLRAFSTEYPYDEEKKKTDYLPVTVNLQDSKVIVDEAPAEEEIVHKSPIFRWLAASLPSSSSGFNR